jgi:hypothetical protein
MMPMRNFIPLFLLKNQLSEEEILEEKNLLSPKRSSIHRLLAYSKSLEVKPSKYMNEVLLHLN